MKHKNRIRKKGIVEKKRKKELAKRKGKKENRKIE